MGAFTHRRDSEYEGEDCNLNVTWISSPFSWAFYVAMIAAFRAVVHYFLPSAICSWEMGWTATHLVHGVVSGDVARRTGCVSTVTACPPTRRSLHGADLDSSPALAPSTPPLCHRSHASYSC